MNAFRIAAVRDARETLVTKGWCQNSYETASGAMCLFRALNAMLAPAWSPGRHGTVAHLADYYIDRLVREAIAIRSGVCWGIRTWNDEPGRTVEDVLWVLDWVIERLETGDGR